METAKVPGFVAANDIMPAMPVAEISDDELDIDLEYCLEDDVSSNDRLFGAPQAEYCSFDPIPQSAYEPAPSSSSPDHTKTSRKSGSRSSSRTDGIILAPESRKYNPPTSTYADVIPIEPYYPDEEQLLREGRLGQSDISARVGKVQFGTYQNQPACLLLIKVNFSPKNRNLFRFRNATVMVDFAEYESHNSSPQEHHVDAGLDLHEKEIRSGLKVRTFYPELIRGLVRSGSNNISFGVSAPLSPAGTPTINSSFATTRPRDGYHVVQGSLTGPRPQTRVRWVISENEISKSGIYEQPRLAVIVQHAPGAKFTMSLDLKATTLAGWAVKGKGGATLKLDPNRQAVAVGGREWDTTSASSNKNPPATPPPAYESTAPGNENAGRNLLDLGTIDLEGLTGMAAALLGASGPGAMQPGSGPSASQAPPAAGDNSENGISLTVPV